MKFWINVNLQILREQCEGRLKIKVTQNLLTHISTFLGLLRQPFWFPKNWGQTMTSVQNFVGVMSRIWFQQKNKERHGPSAVHKQATNHPHKKSNEVVMDNPELNLSQANPKINFAAVRLFLTTVRQRSDWIYWRFPLCRVLLTCGL